MKNLNYVLTIAISVWSCNTSSDGNHPKHSAYKVQEVDSLINHDLNSTSLMTSSSTIERSRNVIINGIDFSIVLNETGDTTHWSTSDAKFETPEGYNIGTSWNIIPMELKKSMGQMPGWGFYIRLNSGWQLVFCEGESCTDTAPNEESIVKWIFKRYS